MNYYPAPSLEGAVELKICEKHGGLFYRKDREQKYCPECRRKFPSLNRVPKQPACDEYWAQAFRRVM